MRFQGGTLFPLVVAIVLVVGLGLVVYARASRPEDVAPFASDHWHGAYGFQICSETPNVELTGNIEEVDADGNLVGTEAYVTSGVHSHDDGVIHWHPTGSRATGRDAQLGVFFGNYGIELSDTRLALPESGFTVDGAAPPEDFPTVYEEGETECEGMDGDPRLTVVVWEDHRDPELEPGVHEQLRRHPVRQERPGDHDRVRARRRRRRDAAVGCQPRGARRSRHAAAGTR